MSVVTKLFLGGESLVNTADLLKIEYSRSDIGENLIMKGYEIHEST